MLRRKQQQKRRNKMSKKRSQYTNSLTGLSKEDIVYSFAYSLATASSSSPKGETRKALLYLWRDYEHVPDAVSEKQLRKYSYRALMHDTSCFRRLVQLLTKATTDRHLMGAITSRIIMDFASCIKELIETDDGTIDYLLSEDMLDSPDGKRKVECWELRSEWSSAVAYLRTFMDKKDYQAELEELGISLSPIYEKIVDAVLSQDTPVMWFARRNDQQNDKLRLTKYSHKSEFYKACLENTYDRMTYSLEFFPFLCGSPEFDSFRGYCISSLMDDASGMLSAQNQLVAGEMEASPLNIEKPDRSAFPPQEEHYFDHWITKGILKEVYAFTRIGVDILAVCRAAKLTKRDAVSIVKEAFMFYEIMKGEAVSFTSKRDKENVTEIISKLWIDRCLEKELQQTYMQKTGKTAAESASKVRKVTDELKKENERIARKLEKAEDRVAAAEKKAESAAKEQLAEIAALRKDIREKERLLDEKDAEIKDLKALFEADNVVEEEEGSSDNSRLTEEEFRAYIQSHNVLIWGLRDETALKFKEMFPELTFISSDRRLTSQQLKAYDCFIMATNYTNHGRFFAARDMAKKVGIPMAYLAKTDNTPETLYRALKIAAYGGAKDLH